MIYARIDKGIVAELVSVPEGLSIRDMFHVSIADAMVEAPATAKLGDAYAGGKFSASVEAQPSLDALKAARSDAVNAKRDAIISAGYQHNFGGTAGIRTLDQRGAEDAINWLGLKGVADAMIAAGDGSNAIAIRDAADETFTASANVVSSAMVAMGVWRSTVIVHSWVLKDAIAVSLDEQHLSQIDIDVGWPDA